MTLSYIPKANTALDFARALVLDGKRVGNSPFYGAFVQMGFEATALPNFSLMAAITFLDAVVAHEPFIDRLLFHELVHVVQYEKLGLEGFASEFQGFLSGGSSVTGAAGGHTSECKLPFRPPATIAINRVPSDANGAHKAVARIIAFLCTRKDIFHLLSRS